MRNQKRDISRLRRLHIIGKKSSINLEDQRGKKWCPFYIRCDGNERIKKQNASEIELYRPQPSSGCALLYFCGQLYIMAQYSFVFHLYLILFGLFLLLAIRISIFFSFSIKFCVSFGLLYFILAWWSLYYYFICVLTELHSTQIEQEDYHRHTRYVYSFKWLDLFVRISVIRSAPGQ